MIREDRELLAELMRLNQAIPAVTVAIIEGKFDKYQHAEFAVRLVVVGEAFSERGKKLVTGVIDAPSSRKGPQEPAD